MLKVGMYDHYGKKVLPEGSCHKMGRVGARVLKALGHEPVKERSSRSSYTYFKDDFPYWMIRINVGVRKNVKYLCVPSEKAQEVVGMIHAELDAGDSGYLKDWVVVV